MVLPEKIILFLESLCANDGKLRKIGFGPFYLPLFCEYSRKQIEAGKTEIHFPHFAYETVKLYGA